jgi:gamma-glutamylaminecyclotransferase
MTRRGASAPVRGLVGPALDATRVFVYGTLKEGFPNFHINQGVRVPGRWVTARRFSLYIVGHDHVPWLVDEGEAAGQFVEGELYDVDSAHMPRMDALENLGEPGGYRREVIDVRRILDDGSLAEAAKAHVYLQDMAHRGQREIHAGPLRNYKPEHAARYRDL